jgi:hypothetical protein
LHDLAGCCVCSIDGLGSHVHDCDVIALEDTQAHRVPFDTVETFARLSDRFRSNLQRLLAQEYSRSQMRSLVLGTMCADKRLAVFLLDLSARYATRGYSSCEFVLRMTRAEVGSHLGLKLETVSRVFSRLQEPRRRACGAPYARERAPQWITGIQSADANGASRSEGLSSHRKRPRCQEPRAAAASSKATARNGSGVPESLVALVTLRPAMSGRRGTVAHSRLSTEFSSRAD